MEHLCSDTTLLLLVFVSAIDPAENHRLLRRSLPDQVQGNDQLNYHVWIFKAGNLMTSPPNGPPGNFHNLICEFTPEQFDVKVLFPFDKQGASNGGDFNIDPNDVRIHPRNSQPFSAIMHIAWRLMRGGSAAEGTAGGGDPRHLAEQCCNLLGLRPFGFLRKLLCYPGIRHDGHRDLYSSIIFDFFAQFLDHLKRSRTKIHAHQFSYLTTRAKEDQYYRNRINSRRNGRRDSHFERGLRGKRHGDGKWRSPSDITSDRSSRNNNGSRDGGLS